MKDLIQTHGLVRSTCKLQQDLRLSKNPTQFCSATRLESTPLFLHVSKNLTFISLAPHDGVDSMMESTLGPTNSSRLKIQTPAMVGVGGARGFSPGTT